MEKKVLASGTELRNGDFRIEEHLGGGGFGITYRATWIPTVETNYGKKRLTEKTVAIKECFYDEFCRRSDNSNEILITDSQKRKEFDRLRKKLGSEGYISNTFKHPNIVKVIDFFEENNTAYIVMEYVEGVDLKKRIDRKDCSIDEAVRYISQIADALIEVHSKQVLHLDISPSNIMINNNDEAQLIDFGVSLIYDSSFEVVKESSRLLSGKKSGFSPPEQTYETLHHFSPTIDLYALGATLYNALTGKIPPDSVLLSTGAESLALPSSYNPNVSSYLDSFVLQSMEIHISNRFQTAAEFKDALLNGEQYYKNVFHHDNDTKPLPANDKSQLSNNVIKKEPAEDTEQAPFIKKYRSILYILISFFSFVLIGFSIWFFSSNKPDSEWIAQYEHHLSVGDNYFITQNYSSAISEYNQALLLIPADSKNESDYKNNLTSKISDCSQKISEQEQQIERERLERLEQEKQAQTEKEAESLRATERLGTLKKEANSAFQDKNWNKAYTLYVEIKSLDANDYTGYNNFLKIGKDLMAIVGCDNNVKDLLTKAKNLRNTNEVNDLLKRCN